MVTVNCAYTEAINPAGAAPVLTREQIWRGLQRKIRHAQDFVPVIVRTEVLDDADDVVTRVAHFKDGHAVQEVCKSYYPTKVDFWQPSGAVITNTVSDGPGLTEHDYHMTYTFEIRNEEIREGSEEHEKMKTDWRKGSQMAVHSSIEAMRKMAAAGELD